MSKEDRLRLALDAAHTAMMEYGGAMLAGFNGEDVPDETRLPALVRLEKAALHYFDAVLEAMNT